MKAYLIVVSVICVIAVFLCLCHACRKPVASPKASIQIDDFIITLSSQQYSYKYHDINPNAHFHFELTVEYVGREPRIEISHGSIIGFIDIVDAYSKTKLTDEIAAIETSSILIKNEPNVYIYTGETEYEYLGGFPRGNYSAQAFGLFATEDKEYTFKLNIPFVIE